MGFFDAAKQTIQHALHPAPGTLPSGSTSPLQAGGLTMPQGLGSSVGASINHWRGHAPNTSDPATARGGAPLHHEDPGSIWGRIGQTVGDMGRGLKQEGLSGLLDPTGMLDRQRAQRELSDRFQVVPDNFKGPRASNQVSEAEYERIAHTFSDIRMGRGDLTIDSSDFSPFAGKDRKAWKQGIESNIADMMMTQGGRDQITGLSNNVTRNDDGTARRSLWGLGPEVHHHTTVKPFFGASDGVDAQGRPKWKDPGWLGRNASTLRYDNATTTPQGSGAERDPTTSARGTGTDSVININPGSILGLRSDVVMDHEMQHALNQTQGTNAPRTSVFGSGVDTGVRNSERQAVGLRRSDTTDGRDYAGDPVGAPENVYREQRNTLGDRFLPRTNYSSLPGEAPATMPDADFQKTWHDYKTGPDISP